VSWHRERFYAWDLETTAQDPLEARVVTSAFVEIVPGGDPVTTTWLVNPGVPISPGATEVHGITDEMAQADGRDPARALPEIVEKLRAAWATGAPVVAFNIAYDLTVLDRELRRNGLPGMTTSECRPIVDPFVLDRYYDKYRPGKRTLGAMCEHHRVRLEDAHSADGDAIATARLAWRLAETYPGRVGGVNLLDLHAQQSGWYAESSAGFADYLRGDADSIERIRAQYWEDIPTAEEIRASLASAEGRCSQKKAERLAKLMKEAGDTDVVADLRHRADEIDDQWPMRAWNGAAS